MRRADARLWAAASTMADLAELTAQWLERTVKSHPIVYGRGGPNSETRPLTRLLAAVNRAGYLTQCSQPGEIDRYGQQRAAVEGFVDEPGLGELQRLIQGTRLIAIVHQSRRTGPCPGMCVTQDGGRDFTWFGGRLKPRDIRFMYAGCDPTAVREVVDAYQVTIVDPEWGRNDLLWPLLAQVTEIGPEFTERRTG